MEVMARSKYIRRAPRKARLVADSVRGLRVIDALAQLEFSPRHAAADVAKAIKDGTIKPELTMYGYDSAAGSGADLKYSDAKPFGPAVPETIAAEVEAAKKKLATGELKVTVTKEDARGGV